MTRHGQTTPLKHGTFVALMEANHPNFWKFLSVSKREHGRNSVEIKQCVNAQAIRKTISPYLIGLPSIYILQLCISRYGTKIWNYAFINAEILMEDA